MKVTIERRWQQGGFYTRLEVYDPQRPSNDRCRLRRLVHRRDAEATKVRIEQGSEKPYEWN